MTTKKRTWTVPAEVLRVVDGDTLEVMLDLGWGMFHKTKVRLAGVNAPEMNTPEGVAARDFARDLLRVGAMHPFPIEVASHSLDKYGRTLGAVTYNDAWATVDLASALLANGHAVKA
jgi:micrococcal nuclease